MDHTNCLQVAIKAHHHHTIRRCQSFSKEMGKKEKKKERSGGEK
jgi:hypothetical protein